MFNICVTSKVFSDVAEVLRYGISECGKSVVVGESRIVLGYKNIILGGHLISDWSIVPDDSVIYNLEQLGSSSVLLTSDYINALKKYEVWDYSLKNIDWLACHGIQGKHVKIGYSPLLRRLPRCDEQDVDVLFYGAINNRRALVLDELRDRGLNVVGLVGVWGDQLDHYISRSKVVVNIHFYETKIFEIVRVGYLLSNGKAVVSEVCEDTEIDVDVRSIIAPVSYESIADACCLFVRNGLYRFDMEERALIGYSARSQACFLSGVL